MAEAELPELSSLIGSSPNLMTVSLANCQLGAKAGSNIAEALRAATALGLPLQHLEARNLRL